jgi:cysteine-S-conjugate beta-lyase
VRTASKPPAQNLVRLHVGLEDPEDLSEDLRGAFAALSS